MILQKKLKESLTERKKFGIIKRMDVPGTFVFLDF